MSVLEDAFRKATTDLDFGKRSHRVVGFYVRRRATKLSGQQPNLGSDQLAAVLLKERIAIFDYIVQKNQALGGPDPKSPPHLDLSVMAKVSSKDGMVWRAKEKELKQSYPMDRTRWIWQIVWRAVAIHDDLLWQSPMPPPTLELAALDEFVDRRLRVVERMACNVNSGGVAVGSEQRSWKVAGPDGPWTDGMLVRMFEYPFLPKAPFEAFLPEIKVDGWQDVGNMILYKPLDDADGDGFPDTAPIRVPGRISKSWTGIRDEVLNLWVRFVATQSTPSDVIVRTFELGHEDFHKRSWLYCDHVGSALNVEALWFGRTRRDGNSSVFDTVMRKPKYVNLGPVVGTVGGDDNNILMADNDDPFFQNTAVAPSDLQVGDFVCFWNNRIYTLLEDGAWVNEYSHVMGIDADPRTGEIRNTFFGPQIWLAGHGLHTRRYNAMAAHLTERLKTLLVAARQRITTVLATSPAVTSIDNGKFIRWAPYEDFDPPGPWWLKVVEKIWKEGWSYPTRDDAVKGMPRTVADDPAGGVGYHRPPDTTAIYFPLWQPVVAQAAGDGDSWRAYLRRRRADPAYRAPTRLAELTVDIKLVPGLYYRGSRATVPVVRPRVMR